MIGTFVAVAVLCAGAVVVGQALCQLTLGRPRPYGGAVGLAALIVLAAPLARLPGNATTAAGVITLVVIAAGVLLHRRRALRPAPGTLAVGAVVLVATAVPFLANARVGLLGTSLDNDTALHLVWAESFRDSFTKSITPSPSSYPIGTHALVATLAQATGASMDHALTALLVAIPVLAAMAALGALEAVSWPWRGVVAGLTGLPYLVASYYAEGAFKETLIALFLLAFAVGLRDIGAVATRPAQAAPLGVVCAGMVYTYSYIGLAWPVLTLAGWLALEAAFEARKPARVTALRRRAVTLAPVAGAGAVVTAVAILPEAGHLLEFFHAIGLNASQSTGGIATTNLGNLAGNVPAWEAFGAWPGPDFRIFPAVDRMNLGLICAVALFGTAYGVTSALMRRETALLAAAGASALIYLRSRAIGESPYVTAKALAIGAPFAVLLAGLAAWRLVPRDRALADLRAGRLAFALLLTGVLGYSSFLALEGAQVDAPAHAGELAQLRPLIARQRVLFLGHDDFYAYHLRGAEAAQPEWWSPIPVALRPEKGYEYGDPFDFDSVDARTLDGFAYVITTRTAYRSEPPPNLRLVRTTRSFELWRRVGPTPPRSILPEGAAPGAVLDCHTAQGRALARRHGVARVMPSSAVLAGPPGALLPGGRFSAAVKLPEGRWELSMPYTGTQPVHVTLPGLRASLPADLDRPGPYFRLGAVTARRGGLHGIVTFAIERPSPLRANTHVAYAGNIIATRADLARRTVPLRRACGRDVDWYRLSF